MTTLPLSLLWLFMLCFARGQISDISSLDDSFAKTEAFEGIDNSTGVSLDEDQKTESQSLKNGNLDAKEEERESPGGGSDIDGETNEPKNGEVSAEKASTSTARPTTGRGRRKFVTQRTSTASNLSGIPSMSPERRNSYLSIAERRKYYNKTQAPIKRPEIAEAELDNQETVNKFVTSSLLSAALENLQINEIPVSRKPTVKESARGTFVGGLGTEKKNLTSSSRLVSTVSPAGEKPKKVQTTRQSVIQSQYEFGQKLNLRRPVSRPPHEGLEEKTTLTNEKISVEPPVEKTTARLVKSTPTTVQSTELLRVNKHLWSTTLVPELSDGERDSPANSDNTETLEAAEYVTVKRSQVEEEAVATDSPANSSSPLRSNKVLLDGIHARGRSEPIKLTSFPLNYVNSSSERKSSVDNEEEAGRLATNIQNVFNQEILRLNATRKTVKVPLSLLKTFQNKNSKVNSSESSSGSQTVDLSTESITQETRANAPDLSPRTPTQFTSKTSNNNQTLITKAAGQSSQRINDHSISDDGYSDSSLLGQKFQTPNQQKQIPVVVSQNSSNSFADSPAANSKTSSQEYPLTIELNENNKRILSEMFNTSTADPTKIPTQPTTTIATTTTTTTTTTIVDHGINLTSTQATTPNPEQTSISSVPPATPSDQHGTTSVSDVDDSVGISVHQYPDEDRKAMGTRYNTKFYISPNASKTQQKVIEIVEADEDEDDRQQDDGPVTLMARPVGVTAYVLAAFGIVPLLLAAVFAAKFLINRRQRRYDCESDGKSDSISTSECQTRLSKRKKTSGDLKKSPSNVTTTTLVTASRLPRVHHHWLNYDKQGNKNWEIPRSRLKMKTILGQGNFGQVWKAEVEDVTSHDGKTRLVAVKTVKEGAGEKEHKEFIKELEIMQQIGSHPNIVTLLGCCTDQEPHYLIMEYVKYGKLLTYLREHRVNENYYNFSNNEDALTSKDLTVFAYCISQGMEYLVSRGIIHRDLAARNVLVDHNKVCKIADFGMSRSVRNFEDGQVYEERQHKGALPIRWMAPESLVYSVFTHKSDVWSFGIVMWEIVTLGSIPYPNMGAREIMRRVRDGYRLERPSHCKPEFYRLMSHCWTHDPNKRPDFSDLRDDLSNLLENPSKDGSYIDLDRFAVDNGYPISSKSRDFRFLGRKECRPPKRLGDWDTDWPEEIKRTKMKRGKNNGKGTVTLTGQGSFTVNSRILEKEFKMI